MEQFVRPITFALVLLCWSSAAAAAPQAELWAFWQQSDERNLEQIDHGRWQQFLDTYVSTDELGVNRVAYQQAADDGGRDNLNSYLDEITAIDPRRLNRTEQMAYWINLYNALTVEVVLRYPKKGSILRMGKKFFTIGPWDDKLINVAGEDLTLNDIEHRILRPIWQDHRIHFAVNCASIGCPNLSTTVYRSDNLEQLLQTAEQQYLNHPRGVQLRDNKLIVSSIFDWYLSDFAEDKAGLLAYLAEHHGTLADTLESYTGRIRYDYDWNLNSQRAR